MTLHSLVEEKHDLDNHWTSRKVTIKELASKLGVSVPTLRKYGECGLLGVDSVSGRTNLFDEAAAVARVEEINRLKSRGYSLSLIREKLDERPAGFMPLELGLEGASFTRGRHALVIMQDMDEYARFARPYVGNALRNNQACMLIADPAHRGLYEKIVRDEGFDLDTVMKRRQVCFAWFENKERLDHHRQIEQYDALVSMVRNAGWQSVRILGQPERDGLHFDESSLEQYEERLTLWARALPVIIACACLAPKSAARDLLHIQRMHREFVLGEHVFMQP
ncbi:MAG: MEDS domain-containing protein [Candidatus Eremiobacteraeota bacterium]|nr:MEDS domain-containing protein [Candidatus Eremiobacteraeota bacterium]